MTARLRFNTLHITATPAALDHIAATGTDPVKLALRHLSGDWGEISAEDQRQNDIALVTGGRLHSAFTIGSRTIWIITEADRSVTTLLFPEEY